MASPTHKNDLTTTPNYRFLNSCKKLRHYYRKISRDEIIKRKHLENSNRKTNQDFGFLSGKGENQYD